MIQYLEHKNIDKSKWDNCIANSANPLIYAYSWYLDAACPRWCAMMLNDYEAVLPLPNKRKYFFDYVYPPFFIQQLGIFTTTHSHRLSELYDNIPGKYKWIEQYVQPMMYNKPKGFSSKPFTTYTLLLNGQYKELVSNYSKNHKRNLQKANNLKSKVIANVSVNDIVTLFRNNRGKEIDKLGDAEYQIFLSAMNSAKLQYKLHTYGICVDNELVCGAVFLVSDKRAIFIFSGNNAVARENGLMVLLLDHFIQIHAAQDMLLDFEGSEDKGIAQFYTGFGAQRSEYFLLQKNLLPFPFSMFK